MSPGAIVGLIVVGLALLFGVVATLVFGDSPEDIKAKPTPAEYKTPSTAERNAARKAAGMPPNPTGAKRTELLQALGAVNPGIVKYESKAVAAAVNQCSAINGGGKRQDWAASQRFTYKDITTTEAQGKQINGALEKLGFCKV